MSLISTMEARLPPGFRFHPRDDELVLDYLCNKLHGKGDGHGSGAHGGVVLVDVDLNKCEPWDLPDMACVGGKEWYFFTLRDRKYATGQRTNRATQSGYWKATGKDRTINKYGVVVGMRKTLVFYQGRAPRGRKTEWVLHEFRMEEQACYHHACWSYLKEDWVLCRVFYKSRTTTPQPASGEAGTTVPSLPLDGYIAFDGDAMSTAGGHYEQMFSFSGIPAIAEKTVRTVLSDMSSNQLESSSSYMQENVMSQEWNAF